MNALKLVSAMLLLAILSGCVAQPQVVQVEVTQVVPQTVQVEVTRVVPETVEVEVTREVRVVVTATPLPPTPTQTPKPGLPGLGKTAEGHGYSLIAVAVEDPASPGRLYTAKPGKKLVAIEVIIGNVSGESFSSNPLYATLVDTEGFTYEPELGARAQGQLAMLDLNPGEKVRGWIAFEVPEGAVPASVKYEFGGWSGIVLQAGLTK